MHSTLFNSERKSRITEKGNGLEDSFEFPEELEYEAQLKTIKKRADRAARKK